MAILKATPEELRAVSQRMSTASGAMSGILNQMNNEIQSMPNEIWESASGRAYNEQFNNVRNNCQAALERLGRHLANLAESAQVLDEMEAAQQAAISSLDSSSIF